MTRTNWRTMSPTVTRFSTLYLQWEPCILRCCSSTGNLTIQRESKASYISMQKSNGLYDLNWRHAYSSLACYRVPFLFISDMMLLCHLIIVCVQDASKNILSRNVRNIVNIVNADVVGVANRMVHNLVLEDMVLKVEGKVHLRLKSTNCVLPDGFFRKIPG
jgi:hypothetical protein